MIVGVVGYSGEPDKPPVKGIQKICVELGKKLAENGYTVFNGGRDGVMELVSKGACEAGGTVVGILPRGVPGNKYLSLCVKTPFDMLLRSFVLVENCDVVVSIGGQVGTAIEVLASYSRGIPVILLRGTGGWTDNCVNILIDNKYFDSRRSSEVFQATNINEIMKTLEKLGGRRHG